MYSHVWNGLSEYRPSLRRKWTRKNRLIFVTGFPTGSHRANIERLLAVKHVAPCILLWPSQVETGNLNYRCHMLFQQATDAAAAMAALNGVEFHGRDLRAEIPQDETMNFLRGRRAAQTQPSANIAAARPAATPVAPSPVMTFSFLTISENENQMSRAPCPEPTDQNDSQCGGVCTPSTTTHAPSTFTANPAIASPAHRVLIETEVSATAISAFMNLPTMWPKDWVYRPEDPNAHERAVYRDLQKWSSTVEEAFPSTSYILGQPSHMVEGLMPLARQYPSPTAVNANCRGAYVTEVKWDRANGTTEVETVLLENSSKRRSQGWDAWHYPARPYDKEGNGADVRQVPKIEDIRCQDQPHQDTGYFFQKLDSQSRGDRYAMWSPGSFAGPNARSPASLSFAPAGQLPSPETITDARTATHNSYALVYRAPQDTGLGWGGHDNYHDWQRAGRQVKKHMVPKQNWNHGSRPVVLACPEDPTSNIVLPPLKTSDSRAADKEGRSQANNMLSRWDKLNPSPARQTRYRKSHKVQGDSIGRGSRGDRGGRSARGGRGSMHYLFG